MAIARPLSDLTRTEDFLAWVWAQDCKFEMIEGRLVMMAGGSRNHSRIAVNTAAALNNRLAGKPCQTYNSDFLIEATGTSRYFPDVTVACDESRDYTDQPVLIIEVLSPSTMRENPGPKRRNYMRIAGLEYLLCVWRDQVEAWLYLPAEGEDARPYEHVTLDQAIDLPVLGLSLPMAELYRDIAFT